MSDKNIHLDALNSESSADRIAEQLEGANPEQTSQLWGEDFAASGGKAPPPSGDSSK